MLPVHSASMLSHMHGAGGLRRGEHGPGCVCGRSNGCCVILLCGTSQGGHLAQQSPGRPEWRLFSYRCLYYTAGRCMRRVLTLASLVGCCICLVEAQHTCVWLAR